MAKGARTPGRRSPRLIIALMALGSGLLNVYSVIGPSLPDRFAVLRAIFPLDFLHLARFITLLMGFVLVILSVNIYRRKRRAVFVAMGVATASVVFHLTKGLDYEEALVSLVLLIALILTRKDFTVRSGNPDFGDALLKVGIGVALALGYGVVGFWLLDRREFGVDFSFIQSIRNTGSLLILSSRPELVPHTGYARWFLESFYFMTVITIAYGAIALFRPVVYRYRIQPHEQDRARGLVQHYGRASLDYFKVWPDKSYFFSPSGESFIAYRVAGGVALALGDPVGAPDEIAPVIRGFVRFCADNDWVPAFYQTTAEYLLHYRSAGLRKLKIGDDGFVDLDAFSLEGKIGRNLRRKVQNLEKTGIRTVRYDPPAPDAVLLDARAVSDDWLRIPGRRERAFSLGRFDWDYLKRTALFAALGADGQMLAFANIIIPGHPGDTTVDLMRHRSDAPNGTMDYLFAKLFLMSKEQGFRRFDMGLAPMAGFSEKEEASKEERAVHYFFQRMNFLFSFQGLLHFKSKFATTWEPRYLIHRNVLDLPRIAFAMARVSELRGETDRELTEPELTEPPSSNRSAIA
ncbi:MAG TPA: phosphatidylglycerol lysyltransferase domain-containing protein [Terriglobia bacterium]|nr:phosphatidylglycerol lysyltransferase domain-containing protein [Terriglobia bacterium]